MGAGEARAGLSGGRQCGAVCCRLMGEPAGASVCYCRMCQKASGGPRIAFGGVRLEELVWTRGAPKIFASSAFAERGFCPDCGTPLTHRVFDRDRIAVTIGSLDAPAAVSPKVQWRVESKLSWLDSIFSLPPRDTKAFFGPDVGSRQRPDHET